MMDADFERSLLETSFGVVIILSVIGHLLLKGYKSICKGYFPAHF